VSAKIRAKWPVFSGFPIGPLQFWLRVRVVEAQAARGIGENAAMIFCVARRGIGEKSGDDFLRSTLNYVFSPRRTMSMYRSGYSSFNFAR
jgi:hypothetical protein